MQILISWKTAKILRYHTMYRDPVYFFKRTKNLTDKFDWQVLMLLFSYSRATPKRSLSKKEKESANSSLQSAFSKRIDVETKIPATSVTIFVACVYNWTKLKCSCFKWFSRIIFNQSKNARWNLSLLPCKYTADSCNFSGVLKG